MSRANVRVRPATPDDLPALVAVVRSVDLNLGTFGRPQHDISDEQLAERLGRLLAQESRVVLVAADDAGEAAGMLSARTEEVGAIEFTRVLHVTHLVVVPRQRRRGVGRSLLAAAVHYADEQGIEHVLADAAAGSREGNRYLARIGFAPVVLHRIAPTSVLRRSLGMTDVAGRMAVLRRARMARAQRSGFTARPARSADTA